MNDFNFCKSMLGHLNSPGYYPIRRAFGQTLKNCSMDAVIAYSKISNTTSETYQNIEFLVAGLCYNAMKPNTEINKYVKFEEVLKRLNREDEISNFLKIRYDNTGYFAKRFMSLAKKTIPLLYSNETFDYNQLIIDLFNWNKNNSVKLRWAMTITNIEEE